MRKFQASETGAHQNNIRYLAPTRRKKQDLSITKVSELMQFKEIVATYSNNHIKHINTPSWQNIELLKVNWGGTYSYHMLLEGYL
jgi:hypothetical protein